MVLTEPRSLLDEGETRFENSKPAPDSTFNSVSSHSMLCFIYSGGQCVTLALKQDYLDCRPWLGRRRVDAGYIRSFIHEEKTQRELESEQEMSQVRHAVGVGLC